MIWQDVLSYIFIAIGFGICLSLLYLFTPKKRSAQNENQQTMKHKIELDSIYLSSTDNFQKADVDYRIEIAGQRLYGRLEMPFSGNMDLEAIKKEITNLFDDGKKEGKEQESKGAESQATDSLE